MVCDEAPAATIGGFNGIKESHRAEIGSAEKRRFNPRKRSDQPRCCGNPSWTKPAGICDGWLHCNIQVVCHAGVDKISCEIKRLRGGIGTLRVAGTANFEQIAQKLAGPAGCPTLLHEGGFRISGARS
jgi:hypothetical protein